MKKIAFILLTALALFSCAKDDIQGVDTSTGKAQLILKTGDFTQIQTRAVAEAQIKDITVLEFKAGTLVKQKSLETMDFTQAVTLDFLESIPAATTQTVTDAYGNESTVLVENGQENLVYILANVKAVTGAEVALTEGTSTFADLKALSFGSTVDLTTVLPMVGYYYGGVQEGATTQINVTLTRTVAKINFVLNTINFVENGVTPSITVNSITLHDVPTDITPYPCANRPALPANSLPGVWPGEMTPFPAYSANKFTHYSTDKNNSTTPATGYIAYIPENVRGSFTTIANNKQKVPASVDATHQSGWSYILVDLNYSFTSGITKNATYKIYLGGDNAGDMNLVRSTQYNVTTYLYGANTADTRITVTPLFDPETGLEASSLNIQKNANSYIISPASIPTNYTIPLTQARLGWNYIKTSEGNGQLLTDFDDLIKTGNWEIVTLWKSWTGTDAITGSKATVSFSEGGAAGEANYFATLTIPSTIPTGNNAVIALVDKNNSNKIYWSWHLWFTDYNPDAQNASNINGQVHSYFGASFQAGGKYFGKKMMDRNLGAVITGLNNSTAISQPQTTAEAVKYYGLAYQFGRKDPFVGSGNGSGGFVSIYDAGGLSTTDNVIDAPIGSNLSNSVQSPKNFYKTSSGNWTSLGEDLWAAASGKSPFDPCPAGWRVPYGGASAVNSPWAGFSNDDPNSVTNIAYKGTHFDWSPQVSGQAGTAGRTYTYTDGTQSWYPTSGHRLSSGTLSGIGTYGYYWSAYAAGNTINAYCFSFLNSNVNPGSSGNRALGFSVRCIQE